MADVPELVIRLYLAGDDCLDGDDETLDEVFTKKFTSDKISGTFMDSDCTIQHSSLGQVLVSKRETVSIGKSSLRDTPGYWAKGMVVSREICNVARRIVRKRYKKKGIKMCLLDAIAKYLPVAEVPEMIIRLYLAGDDCLDGDDETLDAVFTKVYSGKNAKGTATFMDIDCKIYHSFHGKPCYSFFLIFYWYRNGKHVKTT